ncbi:UDP-N-acetylmuramoyl-tripeptide--D-alanyl-D-alanine ligase [Anaerofustis stercorihominis]|uniref:UDP-N-acetylmuramoyl-tripeptide--D-alanyl-D- alanine ligase n=1 Tax=Anaerofustis stercorihominis TaxID=214853 RepID=UPI001106013C|nr:UDP-N-acetylmuramoyl-tripeptide--D-alanyl-D-alanine ligase [Anaerofustis stercorihominis]
MHSIDILKLEKMLGGKIIKEGNNKIITDVVIDSRLAKEGSVFFALPGTAFDGHDFVKKAVENKACCCVVTKLVNDADCYQIKVEDTLKALYDMAKSYKSEFTIPFIALTGSAGKTTTKDMVSSVLSSKYNTMKTIGNYNSTTGAPLTLFNLNKEHEIAVVEMGMNHKGEIEKISSLVEPDFGIITNVGVTHIENLGSKENIFKAKMEITKGLKKGGTLVVNADNEFFKDYKNNEFNIVKIGIENGDFKAYDIVYDKSGVSFNVKYEDKEYSFKLKTPAKYSVYNGLVAIYTGFAFGLTYEQIQKGLDSFKASKNRMDIEDYNGMTLINDTYNSNPDALREALGLLKNISGNNRKVAVLGDMFELGEKSEKLHFECGKDIVQNEVDFLITAGEHSRQIGEGAVYYGFEKKNIKHFDSKDDLMKQIEKLTFKGDYILFKASRGMAFEDVIDSLKRGGNL